MSKHLGDAKTCDQNNWRNHLEDAGQNMKDAGQKIGGGNISHLFFFPFGGSKKTFGGCEKKTFLRRKKIGECKKP